MLPGFDSYEFSTDAVDGKPLSHTVYTKGSGAVIMVLQELPGIFPETLDLVDRLVEQKFRVVMPHLFGPLGKMSFAGNLARLFCMRREFSLFARNKTSPVTRWLAALCQDSRQRYDAKGVGVVGMCLTGNFAISLMADDAVLGSVSSQPSLPLAKQTALHMSDKDVAQVSEAIDQKGEVLAYRFKGDKICKAEKFQALDRAFNTDKQRIRLTELPGDQHAMLTAHFDDDPLSPTGRAFLEICAYFDNRLRA